MLCAVCIQAYISNQQPCDIDLVSGKLSVVVSLSAQLLELEQDVVRGLVLRQPSLLARASEGLQSKVTAYADIFGDDVGQVRTQVVWLRGVPCPAHRQLFQALLLLLLRCPSGCLDRCALIKALLTLL